ncbi:MAG: putative AlkP superfamily phosphohydrolase/phosphomutase [Planctomycetota bacterium]|jgi:predicted AlkP superfamily phosphohydrolase/phosphomutase
MPLLKTLSSLSFRLTWAAALVMAVFSLTSPASASNEEGRVIVLGFDGADARTTQALMDDGQLPNLKRLAADGTFQPLVSTNPAESAAGWAAINTGVNPVKNGVPSFVVRNFNSAGDPQVGAGHTTSADIPIEDFELGGLMGLLVKYDPMTAAAGAGVIVFVAFFVIFGLLLKVRRVLALILALALGSVGGWGAQQASGYVPSTIWGVHQNQVQADGFWDHAARAGVHSISLDAALAFGRPETEGARVLSGLGLPDARGGGNGEWFIYTTDDLEMGRVPNGSGTKSNAGTVFRVSEREGKISSFIYGPEDFWQRSLWEAELEEIEEALADPDLGWKESNTLRDRSEALEQDLSYGKMAERRVKVPMEIEVKEDGAQITIGGQGHFVKEGEWSGWYNINFKMNPLLQVKAVTRVKVLNLDDPFELYVNNLEIDPRDPAFYQPVSSPPGFAAELADWIGEPYETTGWACQTNQLKDKVLGPDTFMEDVEFTMNFRKKLTFAALERNDWRLLFSVFSTTDRTQHMLYKYYDPKHPLYNKEESEEYVNFYGESIQLKDAIPAIYRQMDRIVGEVMERFLQPTDVLMLCADHGFSSFRRGLHVNNWLAAEGFLTLKEGVSKSDANSLGPYIDWSRTKAYSLGLGMVFLNLEGREAQGIVTEAEAESVLKEIQAAFVALEDDGTRRGKEPNPSVIGNSVGMDAMIMKDVYEGPWGTADYKVADIMLGFDENYRVSWSTVFGKIKLSKGEDGRYGLGEMYEDNPQNWSGDHASNSPNLVTGIFFSNEIIDVPEEGVSVFHIAPTVLDRLGVELPKELDMPALGTK